MRRSTGRRRSVALVAVVMTTIGATACGDSQSVPRERLFAPNRGTTYDLTSLGDSAWNHYSADVTLRGKITLCTTAADTVPSTISSMRPIAVSQMPPGSSTLGNPTRAAV